MRKIRNTGISSETTIPGISSETTRVYVVLRILRFDLYELQNLIATKLASETDDEGANIDQCCDLHLL